MKARRNILPVLLVAVLGFYVPSATADDDPSPRGLDCSDVDFDGDSDAVDVQIFVEVLLGNDMDPLHRFLCNNTGDVDGMGNDIVDGRDMQGFVNCFLPPP